MDHLTPGVATVVSGTKVHVSFDPSSSSTFEFRSFQSFYCFKPFTADQAIAGDLPRPTMTYDGQVYSLAYNVSREKPRFEEGAPGVCFLLVDLDQLAENERQRKTLPGHKLGD